MGIRSGKFTVTIRTLKDIKGRMEGNHHRGPKPRPSERAKATSGGNKHRRTLKWSVKPGSDGLWQVLLLPMAPEGPQGQSDGSGPADTS